MTPAPQPHSKKSPAPGGERALLLIDDSKLRQQSFSAAEKILKKMDRLEASMVAFQKEDQKLFDGWFELTFREERAEIERLKNERARLAKFHNWIVALAYAEKISAPAAYLRIKEEERAYENGDEETKRKIELERERRDQYIRSQVEEENTFDEFEEEEEENRDNGFGPSPLTEEEQEALARVKEMDPAFLREAMKDPEAAFDLLGMLLSLSRTPEDFALFLRLWELANTAVRGKLSKLFSRATGMPLGEKLGEMRAFVQAAEAAQEKQGEEAFEENFFSADKRANRVHQLSPEQDEALKLTYRKLVRRLHPDLQRNSAVSGKLGHWQQRVWSAAQDAYKEKSLPKLEHLYKIVLLRSRELNDLTISEIQSSREWLEEELEFMGSEARGMKRHPAWGFHKKKSYEKIELKVRIRFEHELDSTEFAIDELLEQQEYLARLANAEIRKRPRRTAPRNT
jgi:hypothetical protein